MSDNYQKTATYAAAGVVPIAYSINQNGEIEWHILLSVEYRWKHNRECIHPLAGVREEEDGGRPLKTAAREFHEESMGLFHNVNIEEKIRLSIMKGHYAYYKTARLYLFCVEVPYVPDIHRLSLEAKSKSTVKKFDRVDGSELFWYPLDFFLELRGQVRLTTDGERVIMPSYACKHWYRGGRLLQAIELLREDIHYTEMSSVRTCNLAELKGMARVSILSSLLDSLKLESL